MVTGKAGRGRFASNARAIVLPPAERKGRMASIDTPQKLIRLFEKLGYRIRMTANSHYMVYGPEGATITVPHKWEGPSTRDNTLADARRHGLLTTDGEVLVASGPVHNGQAPPKFFTSGGRPTLNYEKENEDMTGTTPPGLRFASQGDLKALVEIVTELSGDLKCLSDDVDVLRKELASRPARASKTPYYDRLAEVRQEILDFLTPFGPGPKFPLSFVTANLVKGDAKPATYMRQLKKLVESGEVVVHKQPGDSSGAHTMYSLAPTKGDG